MMLLYATTAAAMVMTFDMNMTEIYQAAVEADATWAVTEHAAVIASVNFCTPASWRKLKDIPTRFKQTANAIATDLMKDKDNQRAAIKTKLKINDADAGKVVVVIWCKVFPTCTDGEWLDVRPRRLPI